MLSEQKGLPHLAVGSFCHTGLNVNVSNSTLTLPPSALLSSGTWFGIVTGFVSSTSSSVMISGFSASGVVSLSEDLLDLVMAFSIAGSLMGL